MLGTMRYRYFMDHESWSKKIQKNIKRFAKFWQGDIRPIIWIFLFDKTRSLHIGMQKSVQFRRARTSQFSIFFCFFWTINYRYPIVLSATGASTVKAHASLNRFESSVKSPSGSTERSISWTFIIVLWWSTPIIIFKYQPSMWSSIRSLCRQNHQCQSRRPPTGNQ